MTFSIIIPNNTVSIFSLTFLLFNKPQFIFKKKYHSTLPCTFNIQELNVPEKDVEQLLVSLILDNRIDGHIDQVNRLLERGDRSQPRFLY